jgi:hypothetical protein
MFLTRITQIYTNYHNIILLYTKLSCPKLTNNPMNIQYRCFEIRILMHPYKPLHYALSQEFYAPPYKYR